VQQLTRFEFVINLKTARRSQSKCRQILLARAYRVIEWT
jgi:hypothetical protein